MNLLKVLVAGAAVGVILVAFRDFENGTWLSPALPGARTAEEEEEDEEPVLGYDGMDQETVIDWLADSELDRATLQRIRRYEARHRAREPVISAIDDLL